MTGTIGCLGLIAIVIFILLLALWSRRSRQGVSKFYDKYSLKIVDDGPDNVRQLIGALNVVCRRGSIKLSVDREFRFLWWEWFTSSTTHSGNSSQTTISPFLAISFAPNTVSDEFKQMAMSELEGNRGFSFKKAVGYDTSTPIRVETLADGTFVIFWRVLHRPHIMEHKIAWLTKNLTAGETPPVPTDDSVVVEAETDLALMLMQHDGDYIASEFQTYTYYFLVPKSFTTDLFDNTTRELGKVYLEHQKVMREREPDDPNYITIVGVRPKMLSETECAAQPWLSAKTPVREESVCIALRGDNVFKLSPKFFSSAIAGAK